MDCVISVEEYHCLKQSDRQVLGLEDFTDADIEALEGPAPRTLRKPSTKS